MGATEIISTAAVAIDLLNKAIAAANAGDMATAQAYLRTARDHYAQASAAWDAAKQPPTP